MISKGLEALEELYCKFLYIAKKEDKDLFEIIEKDLKRLEELEKAFAALSKDDEKAKKLLSKEIEKNRALEIIKKRKVGQYQDEKTGKWYFTCANGYGLTKEEDEFLKEVLL